MLPFQFLNEVAADTTATAGFHDMMSAMSGMSRIIITTSTRLMTKVLTDTLSMWFSSMRTRSLTICLSAQRPTNQMSKTFMSFMVKESTKVTIASLISSGLIPDIADIMS